MQIQHTKIRKSCPRCKQRQNFHPTIENGRVYIRCKLCRKKSRIAIHLRGDPSRG